MKRPRILVLEGLSGAAECVRNAGGDPFTIDPRKPIAADRALAGTFDGLLLTGGGDIDPRLYGAKPHKKVYGVNQTRDTVEWVALDRAVELGVPVLGICRGHQLMAVHNGGRLKQHIEGHRGENHLVLAQVGTGFRRVAGKALMVTSLHHQVVVRHGAGYRVAARAKDGTIEAVESKDGLHLGVQFHPEINYGWNEGSQRIFRWLVRRAAGAAKMRVPSALPLDDYWAAEEELWLPRRTYKSAPRRPRRKAAPVQVSWLCPHCGIIFDDLGDREDHVAWIHGEPKITVAQPPVGHPDWEEE